MPNTMSSEAELSYLEREARDTFNVEWLMLTDEQRAMIAAADYDPIDGALMDSVEKE